jgi:hypothetical protein
MISPDHLCWMSACIQLSGPAIVRFDIHSNVASGQELALTTPISRLNRR